VDPVDVAHLDGTSAADNGMCSREMPCKTLPHALTLGRKHIKVTGEIINAAVATIDRRTVIIHGTPGAKVTRTGSGFVLAIRRESDVAISDLEIVGGAADAIEISDVPGPVVSMTRVKVQAPVGDGIHIGAGQLMMRDSEVSNCAGAGLNLVSGTLVISGSRIFNNAEDGVRVAGAITSVEIRRSGIYGNAGTAGVYAMNGAMITIDSSVIADNTGSNGGVSIVGPFRIQNSIITRNGSPTTSSAGGLVLNSANAVFEFNTVANNSALVAGNSGINCLGVNPIRLSSSILTDNGVAAACLVDYSLTATTGTPAGTNKTGEPMFLDVTGVPTGPTFFRIGAASAARDSADAAATLSIDIDGQVRADSRRDMGADEFN
jgi:hypothetical protein